MRQDQPTATICGFPVSTGTFDDNYIHIMNCLTERKGQWVVTLNLQMIYRANTYPDYRELLRHADVFIADGVPLIWASKLKKNIPEIAGRSNGTDLVEKLLTSEASFRLGIIGGQNPRRAVEKLNASLLDHSYFYDGVVSMNDEDTIGKMISDLEEKNVNLLFLGLGVPKQDQLAMKIHQKIPSLVIIGVGGAFDLLSGKKSRAPVWMQKNGLEWLHRLSSEPGRLAKRYLIHYPQALLDVIKDITSR